MSVNSRLLETDLPSPATSNAKMTPVPPGPVSPGPLPVLATYSVLWSGENTSPFGSGAWSSPITTSSLPLGSHRYTLVGSSLRKSFPNGSPTLGLIRPDGLAGPPGASGCPSESVSPYGGSVNQRLPSGCGTTSFGELSRLPW